MNFSHLNYIVFRFTAFSSFEAMVNAEGGYRPTIRCYDERVFSAAERAELVELADAYDAFQAARGDERRAYRGSQYVPPAPAPEELEEPSEVKVRMLKAGDQVSLFRNQGDRYGWVLAVRGDVALVEYEMPSGVTYLNLVPADDSEAWYRTVSHRALSRAWREAVVAQGGSWCALERRGNRIVAVREAIEAILDATNA